MNSVCVLREDSPRDHMRQRAVRGSDVKKARGQGSTQSGISLGRQRYHEAKKTQRVTTAANHGRAGNEDGRYEGVVAAADSQGNVYHVDLRMMLIMGVFKGYAGSVRDTGCGQEDGGTYYTLALLLLLFSSICFRRLKRFHPFFVSVLSVAVPLHA